MPVDTSGLERGLMEIAERMAVRLGDGLVAEAQGNASRRTGELAESIEASVPVVDDDSVTLTVTVGAEYGVYQDEGTGIYGPEGVPITPTRPGGVLVFDWPAAGGVVFARRVRGSEPTRFWTKAIDAWSTIVSRVGAGG